MPPPTKGTDQLNAAFKGIEKTAGVVVELISSFVGPLALAYGAAFGFLSVLGKVLGTSKLISRSLQEWARIQVYTPQFEKLLGGLAQAQTRLRMISQAARGAFKFEDLVQANKTLEIFSRGALGGAAGLELVSDVAAVAGRSTAEVSSVIGQLYDDVSNHKPIDGFMQQLRGMGAISSLTADELTNLSYSGASSAQIWAAVEAALRKNKGAADALKNTISGLQETLANTQAEELGKIGEMFSEGKMAGLRAAITLVEKLAPALRDLLGPVAAVFNGFWRMVEGVTGLVTSIGGLGPAIKALGNFLALLAVGLASKAVLETLGVIKLLTAGLLGLSAKTGVFSLIAKGFSVMLVQAVRLLGPLGALLALMEVGLAVAGKYGSNNSVGEAQRKMAKEIRATTDEIKRQVEELQSGKLGASARGGVMAKAAENATAAHEEAVAAKENAEKQKGSSLFADVVAGAGMGAAVGASVGSIIPGIGTGVGAAVGGVAGGLIGANNHQKNVEAAMKQSEESRKAEEEAQAAFIKTINTQPAQKPADYLNNPYMEKMQAESQAKLNDLGAKYAGLTDEQRKGKEGAEIRTEMNDEQKKFSRENQDLSFNKYMESLDTQARLQQSIGARTGNKEATARGDKLADEAFMAKRQKDLIENQKFDPAEAKLMAEGDLLQRQADRERERNPVVASGRQRIGGAMGEAAGGSSEEARILNKMLAVMQAQQKPGYQIPP